MTGPGRDRQREVFVEGVGGRRPEIPTDARRLEERAREAMSPEAFAYVAGGAGMEATDRGNRQAFDRVRIRPRMVRSAEDRDLGVTLLGRPLPAPLLVSPIGVLELAHSEGDLAVTRAASALGLPMVVSSQASFSMEECAREAGEGPRWFQLYWNRSRAVVESFVGRAESAGYEALVLTLDTGTVGWRPRDLDLGYLPFLHGRGLAQYATDPAFLELVDSGSWRTAFGDADAADPPRPPLGLGTLRALWGMYRRLPGSLLENLRTGRPRKIVEAFIGTFPHVSLSWDDIAFLRELTDLPVVLKGILHPDDARRAVDEGADAVWVSNHGGRQVDGAVPALEALPGVVEAVADRVPVLLDSGIRGGADIFKALALGARAVGVGRPYVYGLALDGRRGVETVLRNLVAELDLTMGLTGCPSVDEVGPELLAGGHGGGCPRPIPRAARRTRSPPRWYPSP